ncbi:hypothetical protein [Plasticicumulans acidivorans]|uniref:Uncharacterized protein n=1 Tax=Plasticicumulans acidivorans TaxID=886464 RepID=A0A317N1U4_9GAMM|nr:hypothetical protein [Plasticicumulans acidivorans]PWV65878.1 hypothetical protein C7443_101364 [Plasticicumulans acidivorans]
MSEGYRSNVFAPRLLCAALLLACVSLPASARPWKEKYDNTYGYALMSLDERIALREHMRSLHSLNECRAYQAEHRRQMNARAKAQGKTLPAPHWDACAQLRALGHFNTPSQPRPGGG